MTSIEYRLRRHLKLMMKYYMDAYDGDLLRVEPGSTQTKDAYRLMRDYDFIDKDGEEIDEDG